MFKGRCSGCVLGETAVTQLMQLEPSPARRPCTVPEVGMTDVYYGDLERMDYDVVQHINEVCEKNIVSMLMKAQCNYHLALSCGLCWL